MFPPHSIYNFFSKLFDFYGFHGQNVQKQLQNIFHTILNIPINIKQPPEIKKKNKVDKVRGGGLRGRYECGQRFNGF